MKQKQGRAQAIIGAFKVQSLDLLDVGEKRLGIVYIFYVCTQNYILINVFIWEQIIQGVQ